MWPVRLVGTDALRGDDEVETERELSARAVQRRIVDVTQRTDLRTGLERRESRVAVRIGGPPMRHGGEGLPFPLVDGDPELAGDAIEASAQDLGIEMRRALLLNFGAGAVERQQEILPGSRDAMVIGPSAEKSAD